MTISQLRKECVSKNIKNIPPRGSVKKGVLIDLLENYDKGKEIPFPTKTYIPSDDDLIEILSDEDISPQYKKLIIGLSKDSDIIINKKIYAFTGIKGKEDILLKNLGTSNPFEEIIICDYSPFIEDETETLSYILPKIIKPQGKILFMRTDLEYKKGFIKMMEKLGYTANIECSNIFINGEKCYFDVYSTCKELPIDNTPKSIPQSIDIPSTSTSASESIPSKKVLKSHHSSKKEYKSQKIEDIHITKKSKEVSSVVNSISFSNFLNEIDDDEFISNFAKSIKNLMKYKLNFYNEMVKSLKKEYEKLQKKVKELSALGVSPSTIKEKYPLYEWQACLILDLEDIITSIIERLSFVDKLHIKENLLESINNQEVGINSLISRDDLKDTIARQLYSFSKSFNVFTKSFNNIALLGNAGSGKCMGKDTPILMYDGTIKNIQNISIGDLIMGDDSTPRNVLSLARGREPLYKITPEKGEPYIVNESHILSLKKFHSKNVYYSNVKKSYIVKWDGNEKIFPLDTYSTFSMNEVYWRARNFYNSIYSSNEEIIDISVRDLLSKNKFFREIWGGYKTSIDFKCNNCDPHLLDVDPYFYGVWLMKGRLSKEYKFISIDIKDEKILTYLKELTVNYETKYSRDIFYIYEGELYNKISNYVHGKVKSIPLKYLTSSRKSRLSLLGGIIDSLFYLDRHSYVTEINYDNEPLIDDIMYIARSVGLSARIYKTRFYKRLIIKGDLHSIYLLSDKKRPLTYNYKNPLIDRITIEPLGEGDYYGFEIDGNHRYVLGDFTVTHNTHIAKVLSYVYSKSGILATDNVKIVSRAELVGQYVGQTAPRTQSILLQTLEGVLFIDEAYQLAPNSGGDSGRTSDYGSEAITEIVNFTDKYVGMSVVMVAGYEAPMLNFFKSNEGLPRRFPYRIILNNYTINELTDILLSNLSQKNIKISEDISNFIFNLLVFLNEKVSDIFVYQAGDMLNLGSSIEKSIYSSYKIKWGDNIKDDISLIKEGVINFLEIKGYTLIDF